MPTSHDRTRRPTTDRPTQPPAAAGDEAAAALCARYQAALAAGDGPAAAAAFGELFDAHAGLLRRAAREAATRRWGPRRARDLVDDLVSEATVAFGEAAASFDAAKGRRFTSWAMARVDHALGTAVERPVAAAGVPISWQRVSRISHACQAELTATLGREPGFVELRDAVRAHALNWAAGRASSRREARAKLVKQGTWAAIDNLAVTLSATQSALSLDAPAPESGATLADVVAADDGVGDEPSAAAAVLGVLAAEDLAALETLLAGGDGLGLKQAADLLGCEWTELRRRRDRTVACVKSPHWLYARFAPGLADQFDDLPASGAGRLRRRLAAGG